MSTAPSQLSVGPVTGSSGSHNLVGVFNGAISIGRQGEENQTQPRASDDCRNALFVSDPYIDRETLIGLKGPRVDGTCLWITKHEKYLSWLQGQTPLLWISGGPGKGKTIMSIFLSQELEKVKDQAIPRNLVFFFCSHDDKKRNTALGILRSLIHQILSQSPQLIKHLEAYFATSERTTQTILSLESLWIIFTRSIDDPEFPPTRCVIDGLDECDKGTRRLLVAKLLSLFKATDPNSTHPTSSTKLSLVVISRAIPDLRGCTEIKIDPDNDRSTTDDLGRFVSARVQELSKIEGMTAEVLNYVESTLRARAQGTFLWAGFAMHELLQQSTCSDILNTLSKIPSGLFAIYSRMLSQIPTDRQELSKDILDWVAMAMRPLTLLELAAAHHIKPTSNLIDEEHSVRDAIRACEPFLKFDGSVVTLVHQSARDYLLRDTPDDNSALEAFRIRPYVVHLKIAETCLDCICFHNPYLAEYGGKVHDRFHDGLLSYSAFNARKHVESIQPLNGQLDNVAKRMFSAQCKENCRRVNWPSLSDCKDSMWIRFPPLHMACYLGIVSWISILLRRTVRIARIKPRLEKKISGWTNHRGGKMLYNPLKIAAREGHEQAVAYLINRGARTNSRKGYSPLYYAVLSGQPKSVKILLKRGARTKGEGLVRAYVFSGAKSTEIWKMLVKHKIDIHERSCREETALHFAAECDSTAAVSFLIKQGIKVNATDTSSKTALHMSVYGENASVLKLLLANGADPTIETHDGSTALDIARYHKRTVVIQAPRNMRQIFARSDLAPKRPSR